MPLITVSPTVLKRVTRGEKLSTTLYFTIPRSGSFNGKAVVPPDGKVVLAVYDLDQYLSVQSVLPSGFREDDETFFDGTETDFPSPLQRHVVRPNSGVLFIAELELAKRTKQQAGRDFFVKNVRNRQQQDDPAYEMRILTDSRVDEAGHEQPQAPIQLGSIGTVAAASEDFNDFSTNEATTRVMVFRLLTPDLKTVLLSTRNPAHSSAGVAIKRVLYSPTDKPKPIGSEHDCNDVKPTAGSRLPVDDPTGLYVEVLPGQDDSDPIALNSPAILWVHQVGRVLCGWYAPIRSLLLTGHKPLNPAPIVEGDISKMMHKDRVIFLVDVFLDHSTLKRKRHPADGRGIRDIVFCKATPGALEDPDELVLFTEAGTPVIGVDRQDTGLIRVLPEDIPVLGREVIRVELSLDGTTFSRFRKIDGGSRLSWRAFQAVKNTRPELGTARDQFVASLIEDVIEPLPPGIWVTLTREIVSPTMLGLINQFIANKNQQVQSTLLPEDQINTFLDVLAGDLRLTSQTGSLASTFQSQVRAVARSETITVDGQTRTVLSLLEEISGALIERQLRRQLNIQRPNPLPLGRPNDADYQAMRGLAFLQGFSAFDIRPPGNFTYKFTFKEIQVVSGSLKRFVMLKGSVGLFQMTVDKLDATTRLPVDLRGFRQQTFVCLVLGGSFGLGVESEIDGIGTSDQKVGKPKAGTAPAPKPIDCEVNTFLDLQPEDFDFASFLFFSHLNPNFSVSNGTIGGISSGLGQETIFSLTLLSRSPQVTLETVVNVPPKPLDIKGPDLHRIIENILKGKKPDIKIKLNAVLFALTSFGGIVLFKQDQSPVPRPDDKPLDSFIDKPIEAVVTAAGPSFGKACASLNESSRKFLDIILAVQRRLLEYPGYIDIQGTASPEFGRLGRDAAARENRELSLRRAQFVEAAIFAAAGSPGKGIVNGGKDIVPAGVGSDVFALTFTTDPTDATPGSILDPFVRDQQTNPAAYDKRLHDERKNLYPTLRRVDVVMNGLFAVRFKAE